MDSRRQLYSMSTETSLAITTRRPDAFLIIKSCLIAINVIIIVISVAGMLFFAIGSSQLGSYSSTFVMTGLLIVISMAAIVIVIKEFLIGIGIMVIISMFSLISCQFANETHLAVAIVSFVEFVMYIYVAIVLKLFPKNCNAGI